MLVNIVGIIPSLNRMHALSSQKSIQSIPKPFLAQIQRGEEQKGKAQNTTNKLGRNDSQACLKFIKAKCILGNILFSIKINSIVFKDISILLKAIKIYG